MVALRVRLCLLPPCRFTPITEEEEGPAAAAAGGQLLGGSEDGVKPAEPTDWNSDGEPSDEGDGQGQGQGQGDRAQQGEAAAATGSSSGVAAAGMQGNGTEPAGEASSSRGRLSAL